MEDDPRRFAPATSRNRDPILDVLRGVVPDGARVLEIASGSGEHATYFGERLAVESWQPSDPDPDARASIDAWRAHLSATRVLPAIDFDVTHKPWPALAADVLVCINMIHISPWESTVALFEGAGALLPKDGVIFLYGPYKRNGAHTSPSNDVFDRNLRARDPRWGVRDLEAVLAEANRAGFIRVDLTQMPANNFSVVLRRG